ncbi:unnamed protein product [Scytosiphon promiscuus]
MDGRERWRRRGQRLWRQGSSTEPGGNTNGSRNNGGSSSSSNRRSRGNRRRSWGQGWATGRLQGLWGGSAGETGEGAGNLGRRPNLSAAAAHMPPVVPLPPPDGEAAAAGAVPSPPVSPPAVPISHGPEPSTDGRSLTAADPAADAACQQLSWVMLPSSDQGGGSTGAGGGAEADASSETPSSPAGRSFHCAFFHGGACYVTGGSDGARKFGDMWRFRTRESPPPLATLAARAFARNVAATTAKTTATRQVGEDCGGRGGERGGAGGGGGGGGSGGMSPLEQLLQSLPEEVREALRNLNMQAEVVL